MNGGSDFGPWECVGVTTEDCGEGVLAYMVKCPGGMRASRANARLIAAAPALLDAMEELFVRGDVHIAFAGNPVACDALEAKCRAAIAKARGTSCTCGDSAMVGNECKGCGARVEA